MLFTIVLVVGCFGLSSVVGRATVSGAVGLRFA